MSAYQINCIICNKKIKNKITSWTYYCKNCDYWGATLGINIEAEDDHCLKDDGVITFLDDIRVKNFTKILDNENISKSISAKDAKVLDVGCATGLFMKIVARRGVEVLGLEPNPIMAKIATSQDLNVRNGYFPSALNENERFDVIIFNDVFEHIPDLKEILNGCFKLMKKDGYLVINLPNSRGLFFRLASLFTKFGFYGPWERLWQTMFYTPHLHYFSPKSLNSYVKLGGFGPPLIIEDLDTINLSGLWGRVSVDSKNNLFHKIIYFFALLILIPITYIFPKDTFFAIYKKMM
jgi:SAM-dependent methyltransferase